MLFIHFFVRFFFNEKCSKNHLRVVPEVIAEAELNHISEIAASKEAVSPHPTSTGVPFLRPSSPAILSDG